MATADLAGIRYEHRFRTVGALRAAAYRLCEATRGLRCGPLAVELHDSICATLIGPPGQRLNEVARLIRRAGNDNA